MRTLSFLSSKTQEALGNLRGAMVLAEKSVEIDPGNASYHAQLAECYAYTADRSTWVKGISFVRLMKKELDRAFAIHPHDSDAALVAMMSLFTRPPSPEATASGPTNRRRDCPLRPALGIPCPGPPGAGGLHRRSHRGFTEEGGAGRSEALPGLAGVGHILLLLSKRRIRRNRKRPAVK